MANWKYKFEIKDLKEQYDSREITVVEYAGKISQRITDKVETVWKKFETELSEVVKAFDDVYDVETFDSAMMSFNEWGNQEIKRDKFDTNTNNMSRMCWINING